MGNLTPRIIVSNAVDAIAFYRDVFGALEQERYTLTNGAVVHATLRFGDAVLALAEEAPDWHNHAPPSLGGSPVILALELPDPDAVCAKAVARGATVLFPIADQPYGFREGRIADPFGHLWILSRRTESLDPAEIQRRLQVTAREP